MWLLNSLELNPLDCYFWGNVKYLSQALYITDDIVELKEMQQMTV